MMKKIVRIFLITLAVIIFLVCTAIVAYYPAWKFMQGDKSTFQIDSQLSINLGKGCNTGIFTADSVILVIDTRMGKAARLQYEQVEKMAKGRKIIIINTHADGDHTLGNKLYSEAILISSRYPQNYWIGTNGSDGVPSVWVDDTMVFHLGDETISLINVGQAHTWNDLVVYFHKRKVLFAGDILFNRFNPFLLKEKGSCVEASITVLDKLMKLDDIRILIPGHGQPGGKELIEAMKEYYEDMLLAASDPEFERTIRKKYCNWISMPLFTSVKATIRYIRMES